MIDSKLEIQMNNNIPQNIKDIESLKKLMDLYNDSFDELESMLEDPLLALDTDYLIKKFEETNNVSYDNTRKELFKIHLGEIYKTFENIDASEDIYKKFKLMYDTLNIPTDNLKIVAKIDKTINKEYINASGAFKAKKGTKSGFFFIYDIINKAGIQSLNADPFFRLIEGTEDNPKQPYSYTVESSLYKEVYSKTVLPLAHPVGFDWNFSRLLLLSLSDYFGLKEINTLTSLLITCYGLDNITISQDEIISSETYGKLKLFEESLNEDNDKTLIVDFYSLDGSLDDGYRFILDANGRGTFYDRQLEKTENNELVYLDISEIKLLNSEDGTLSVNYIERSRNNETYQAVQTLDYTEYTIINKEYLNVLFKVHGDRPDVWYTAKIKLDNKIVQQNPKLFETVSFSRIDIFENASNYNGYFIEELSNTCQINYTIKHELKVITNDISAYVESKRPLSKNLPKDVTEIFVSESDYNEAISKGLDPYQGLYSSTDHTIEESDYKILSDNFGEYGIDLLIGDPEFYIDKPYLNNLDGEYYIPIIGGSVSTYREEFDFSYNFDVTINQRYCPDIPTEGSWNINEEGYFIGCPFINLVGTGYEVDAEVYRSRWDAIEGEQEDFEKIDVSANYYITEPYPSIQEKEVIKQETNISDNVSKIDIDLFIGDDIVIGGKVYMPILDGYYSANIGGELSTYDDDLGTEIYRFNPTSQEWEIVPNNNMSAL